MPSHSAFRQFPFRRLPFHRFPLALLLLLSFALLPWPVLAAHAPHSRPEVRVGIVLFDGVQIIDFAGPYEVFGTAGFGVTTLSPDGKPVTTAMGLKVTPDAAFADAPPFDVVLMPGGDVEDAEKDPRVLDFLRRQAGDGRELMSVCTGAFVLASAGLLDGLEATTFTPRIGELARRFPKVKVVRDVRWADNRRILTSAGLSSGLDAALHLVAKLRGVERARSVALHLEYDWKPEGGFVRSRLADRHLPTRMDKAVDWPKDLDIRQDYSLGDERQWRKRFLVVSATPAAELLRRIGAGMDRQDGWSRAPGELRWHSEREGRRWWFTLASTPGADAAHYAVEIGLHVDAPESKD